MRTKWFVLLFASLTIITLWGCGSNGGSGGSDVGDPADVDSVGIQNCAVCHEAIYNAWNGETNRHNNYVTDRDPRPDNSSVSGREECEVCHDPTGDSANVFPSRPVVGCEGCHGGGSAHRGVGPIPYPYPDPEQCAECHDSHFSAQSNIGSAVLASVHNNSDDLHASSAKCQRCHTKEGSLAFSSYTGDKTVMDRMDPVDPDDPETSDNDNVPSFNEEDLNPITCTACHDAHDGSLRADSFIVNDNDLAMGNWDPNGSGTPDQFDFCTSCHTYYSQAGELIGSGKELSIGNETIKTDPFYHNTAWYRTVTTTHYDIPVTNVDAEDAGTAENLVEGYVVRQVIYNPSSMTLEPNPDPCFDCHGHEFRTNTRRADEEADPEDPDTGLTIHTQWASSGHGGRLLPQVRTAADAVECDPDDPETSRGRCPDIVDAAMMAGVDPDSGDAWIHYNWDKTEDGATPRSGRADCQECHTATGAMNYLNDPDVYNAAVLNDFSHLDSWTATEGSGQNELLYCWGCHENAANGDLRNPGAITRPYSVGGVPVNLDDLGNSNVCVNCHGARGNMEEYFPEVMEDPTTDFTGLNAGFGPGTKNVTEAHYLVAAATIYAADTRIGYEYSMPGGALLDYTPVSYYAHDGIALNGDSPETGSGSCAACHMETAEPHLFEVVTKDDSGVIISLNSTVCIECHDGENGPALEVGSAEAAAFLEEEAEGYHETIEILEAALGALGIVFQDNYPYFDTTIAGSWINEGNFGAAHNYNYLYHEPGAYAHNRIYTKRLLFDSIDWVDNYTLDGTITIDAATYPEAAHWLGADDVGFVSTRP